MARTDIHRSPIIACFYANGVTGDYCKKLIFSSYREPKLGILGLDPAVVDGGVTDQGGLQRLDIDHLENCNQINLQLFNR